MLPKIPGLLFALWILMFVVLFVAPIGLLVAFSLSARDFNGGVGPFGALGAWRSLISTPILMTVVRSIFMALCTTTACWLCGLPCALWLHRRRLGQGKLAQALLMLPLAMNPLLVALAWQVLLGHNGPIDNFVSTLTGNSSLELLNNRWSILAGLLGSYLPVFVLIVSISLSRIDPRIEAAAASLGADPLRVFVDVTLPLSRSGLAAATFTTFVPAMAEYVIPDLLGGGKSFYLGGLAQFLFYEGRNWPLGSALLLSVMVLLFATSLPTIRFVRDMVGTES